jgi:hypothetical protein
MTKTFFSVLPITMLVLFISGCNFKKSQSNIVLTPSTTSFTADSVKPYGIGSDVESGFLQPLGEYNPPDYFDLKTLEEDAFKKHQLTSLDSRYVYHFTVYELGYGDPAINGDYLAIKIELYSKQNKKKPFLTNFYDPKLNIYNVDKVTVQGNVLNIETVEEYFPDETDKDLPSKRKTTYSFKYSEGGSLSESVDQ